MKSGKTIRRENIHIGLLFLTDELYVSKNSDNKEEYVLGNGKYLRSMLYTVDKDGFTKDLLYKSPQYPILGVTEDKHCITKKGEEKQIILQNWNLGLLLKTLGYQSILTSDDIVQIRKNVFDSLGSIKLKILSERIYQQYQECIEATRDLSFLEAIKNHTSQNAFKPKEGRILKRKK
ncbi:MAG: hypothetical protein IJ743_00955 [Bacilli bacterium]|nr:hypothetical protein [Bacilli bacterium]